MHSKVVMPDLLAFFSACRSGDLALMTAALDEDASLVRERTDQGSTPLHLAVPHSAALQLLLDRGADPDARDTGDNATALHFAAGGGHLESVRVLLEAGADVHGNDDLHRNGVIGWAARRGNEAVVDLLLAAGARHHIFSAMGMVDTALVAHLIDEDAGVLRRRRSVYENEQTPLHAAFAPPDGLGFLTGAPNYEMMRLLIDRGAELEALDNRGRTPLEIAILRGDDEAMRLLRAAGAREPRRGEVSAERGGSIQEFADGITGSEPMFSVADMRATLRWYKAIGFSVPFEYEDGGEVHFARVAFGAAKFCLSPGGEPGPRDVSFWLYTTDIDSLYRRLRAMQQQREQRSDLPIVKFEEDLHTPFYSGRQFSIKDPNGVTLIFLQPTPSP